MMKNRFLKIRSYAKMLGLVGLVLAAFSFAMFQGGFVSWFLFYAFSPFAIYSLFLFFYTLDDFSVNREMNKSEYRAGDNLKATVIFTRKNRFPLLFAMAAEEGIEHVGNDRNLKKAFIFPWFKRRFSLEYTVSNLSRGEHYLGKVRLKTGDILGLFEKEAVYELPQKIVVYPTYYDLSYKQLEYLLNQGQAGSAKQLQREHSMASGIREYQPGDQMSWINWKATAKKNEIITKEFEEQKSHDLFVILDEQPSELFEEMIIFTASFVHAILQKNIQTGFLGTSMEEPIISVRRGDAHKKKIFYRLAKAVDTDTETFDMKVESNHMKLLTNASLIMITSRITRCLIDKISANKANQRITILCIKKDPRLTEEETSARLLALTKGIRINYVEPGSYDAGLIEVMAK